MRQIIGIYCGMKKLINVALQEVVFVLTTTETEVPLLSICPILIRHLSSVEKPCSCDCLCPGMSSVPAVTDRWQPGTSGVCIGERGAALCTVKCLLTLGRHLKQSLSSIEHEANTPKDFFALNFFQVQKQRKSRFPLPHRINLSDAPFQFLY